MPRRGRTAVGGLVYHVLNRANGGMALFEDAGDYHAFERLLVQAHARMPMRTLAYCLMLNHWHLVLWPCGDGDLSAFMQWLTLTHARRWHAHRQTSGTGHVYQGRFKSFPVQTDGHLLAVCRYVERNALRAGLVERAEHWPWSSLTRRERGDPEALLCTWPVGFPGDWMQVVNETEAQRELDALRVCATRGRPFGTDAWSQRTVKRLGLEHTLRPRGRPRRRRD